MGEEADGFGHGCLEGAAMRGVGEAVRWEGLAEGEECGCESENGLDQFRWGERDRYSLVLKADVVAAEAPARVARV